MNSIQSTFSKKTYKLLLKYFFLIVVSSILVILVLDYVTGIGLIEPLQDTRKDTVQKYGLQLTLLFTVILAPILEEFTFRLYLIYDVKFLSTSASLLLFFLLVEILTLAIPQPKIYAPIITVLVSSIAFAASFSYLKKDESGKQTIKDFYSSHKKEIFYFSIALFGFFHLNNYVNLSIKQILFSPLIVGSQLVSGYFLGKLRINHGLIWSIQLHMLINGLGSLTYLVK